jgi:hypothetical protein
MRRIRSRAWSHGTSRSSTVTEPETPGSSTMLSWVRAENVRSTSLMSASLSVRVIGSPVWHCSLVTSVSRPGRFSTTCAAGPRSIGGSGPQPRGRLGGSGGSGLSRLRRPGGAGRLAAVAWVEIGPSTLLMAAPRFRPPPAGHRIRKRGRGSSTTRVAPDPEVWACATRGLEVHHPRRSARAVWCWATDWRTRPAHRVEVLLDPVRPRAGQPRSVQPRARAMLRTSNSSSTSPRRPHGNDLDQARARRPESGDLVR